ncbi:MAG: hypothetical protein HFH02_09780 [Dorea sp.]|nr:hypothetical protein [Dorea sp.]
MSQEKVDRYKKEKANRKQTVKKEKIQNVLRKCVVGVVALLLISWIGYSAYGTYESKKPKEEVEIDYTALTDFTQKLSEAAGEAK